MTKKKKKKKSVLTELEPGIAGSETSSVPDSEDAISSSTTPNNVLLPISMGSKVASGASISMEEVSGATEGTENGINGSAPTLPSRIVRTGDSLFDNAAAANSTTSPTDRNGSATIAAAAQKTYERMLDRVYAILRDKNPELVGGRRKWAPIGAQVAREGSKKVGFYNFFAVCQQ